MLGRIPFEHSVWQETSEEAKDLIRKLLTTDPEKRYTCHQALAHPWFRLRFADSPANLGNYIHAQGGGLPMARPSILQTDVTPDATPPVSGMDVHVQACAI